MPGYDPLNPHTDCFKPPAIPTEVCCLHCGREYESYLIEWRVETTGDNHKHGFWCCPTPGCDGRGFGFDILPTDPEYVGEDGEAMYEVDDECETLDEDDFEPFDDGIPLDVNPRNRISEFEDDNIDDIPF